MITTQNDDLIGDWTAHCDAWWTDFREPYYDSTFMISSDEQEYFFFEAENRGDACWCRGQIGEKPGACEGRYGRTPAGLLELFPDGDQEILRECTDLPFRDFGVYLAQSAGFTWFHPQY